MLNTLIIFPATAQMEGNIWHLGTGECGLDFTCGSPSGFSTKTSVTTLDINNKLLYETFSFASICDSNGNFLFMCNEKAVWDRNFNLMPNGKLVKGTFNTNDYQKVIIVPHPGIYYLYYIFFQNNGILQFVTIDMRANSGLGDVTSWDTLNSGYLSGLTAIRHRNNRDFWLLSIYNENRLYAFQITSAGIVKNPVISKPCNFKTDSSVIIDKHLTTLRTTLKGDKIAYRIARRNTSSTDRFFIITKFNNQTGHSYDSLLIPVVDVNPGGICFSPDGTKLFATDRILSPTGSGTVFQYDLCSWDSSTILASKTIIDNISECYDIQLGPDGKLYVGRMLNKFCSVVNKPDNAGLGCNYTFSTLSLGGNLSYYSIFPNFITRKPYVSRFNIDKACENQPVKFTPENYIWNSQSFYWDFGDTISGLHDTSTLRDPFHTFKLSGKYKVRLVTYINGEYDTSARYVCVQSSPNHIQPKDTVVCTQIPVTLNAGNIGASYLWSNGVKKQNVTFNQSATVWVKITIGSCSITDTFNVNINPFKNKLNLGNDTVVCKGDTVYLKAKYTNCKYKWSSGDTSYSIKAVLPGTYFVEVKNGSCSITDTILITHKPLPFVNLGNDTVICGSFIIKLDAGSDGNMYQWNTGETTRFITVSKGGVFVVALQKCGCITKDSIKIDDYQNPIVDLGKDTALCENDINRIILDAGLSFSYYWQPNNEGTRLITVTKIGIYSVTVTDINGCKSSDSIKVNDNCDNNIYFPNAFTPNGDGLNDQFKIFSNNLIKYKIVIYNRWGEKIFESNDVNHSWNGEFLGQPCPIGVYYYYVVAKNSKFNNISKMGSVTIIK